MRRSRTYDGQFSVLLRKVSNGVPRLSFGPVTDPDHVAASGYIPDLMEFFPSKFRSGFVEMHAWGEVEELNWD
jgi:hypothetical protein